MNPIMPKQLPSIPTIVCPLPPYYSMSMVLNSSQNVVMPLIFDSFILDTSVVLKFYKTTFVRLHTEP